MPTAPVCSSTPRARSRLRAVRSISPRSMTRRPRTSTMSLPRQWTLIPTQLSSSVSMRPRRSLPVLSRTALARPTSWFMARTATWVTLSQAPSTTPRSSQACVARSLVSTLLVNFRTSATSSTGSTLIWRTTRTPLNRTTRSSSWHSLQPLLAQTMA